MRRRARISPVISFNINYQIISVLACMYTFHVTLCFPDQLEDVYISSIHIIFYQKIKSKFSYSNISYISHREYKQ